jgi:hypothetical protein
MLPHSAFTRALLGLGALAWAAAGCQPAAPAAVETATPPPPTATVAPTAAPTLTPVPPTATLEPQTPVLFDDFGYADHAALEANGWVVRTAPGWPGVPGATWWPEGITFHDSDERPGDRWLRLASATDGTEAGTRQAQLCHQRKYREGT